MKRIALIILALLLVAGGYIALKFFGPAVRSSQTYFYVRTGDDMATLKENLVYQQVIPSDTWFDRMSQLLKFKKVKPGRYKLEKGMSLFKLVRMLRAGNHSPVNFVITKLRTKEALASKAGAAFETDSLQMIRFLSNPDSLHQFGLDTNTVMAAVMPYTYTLNWNTNPGKLFRNFHNSFTGF